MEKINILLVNPYIHDFCAFDLWMKPLGLYWIAGYLQKFDIFKITLVDCMDRFNPLYLQGKKRPKGYRNGTGPLPFEIIEKPKPYKEISKYYKRFGIPLKIFHQILDSISTPNIILITSIMTYWYPGVFETIQILKRKFPKIPIGLGGIYATLCSEHARKFAEVDKIFKGPSEIKVLEWINEICGLDINIKNEYEKCYPNTSILKETELHLPAHNFLFHRSPGVISTSLGCPLKCPYCASRIIQPIFRQRPYKKVLEEILYLVKKKHVRDIALYDDAFLISPSKHAIPLLESIISYKLQVNFHTPNGLHSLPITLELAKLMKKANFKTVRFSYEQREVFPPHRYSKEDKNLERAISYMKEAGYGKKSKIEVYVKTGLPDQTEEEIIEGFLFVHRLGAYIRIADYSPVPNTPDFEKIINKYGLDANEPLYHNNTALPYIIGKPNPELFQQVKGLAGTLNFALERGINLYNSSKLAKLIRKVSK